MKKKELATLLESVSLQDLKKVISQKEKLGPLEKKKKEIEKSLASVNRQIESLQRSVGKTGARGPGRPKGTTKKKEVKKARKRIRQPSLSSLIVDILKEKKEPLGVNNICEGVLKEKGYKTKAKNFKSQVRILLYKNEKGLFKKVGPGEFGLAGERKPTTYKKNSSVKKTATRKRTGTKKKR
jgi:HB1, ASXL, restriction endonuclease HTH domain